MGAIGAFVSSVEHPLGWTQDRWREFKHLDSEASAASHFGQLGSNRYDFWRVAFAEFGRHPVAGVGGHGWPIAYRRHGESEERPQRAHSLELDALSETGIVGLLLLVAAGLAILVAVGRRAGGSLVAAGALGAGAYFAIHTGGDWVWSIPAVGVPAFAILGIGASIDRARAPPTRAAVPAGVAAILVGVLAFAPTWLSARLVNRAYDQPTAAAAANDLRWARRLDPLAIDPLVAESALAKPPETLPPLERALARQPRDSEMYFLLGLAYLDAGRKADARRLLLSARRLAPRNETIQNVLREASE